MDSNIAFVAGDRTRAAIASIGRTEDVHFSPDNSRLAVAGMIENTILVLDVAIDGTAPVLEVRLTDHLLVGSPALNHPHGLFWLDNDTLVVGNRLGNIPIFMIPTEKPESRRVELAPLSLINADDVDLAKSPGSVSTRHLGGDLYEALACNNRENYVSRYLLDARAAFAILSSDVLLRTGFQIPDGVAYSRTGSWIAISNHDDRSVFVYRNREGLSPTSQPDGVLRGMAYAHGLRFAPDGNSLYVADAGQPFVHIFTAVNGDWTGPKTPSRRIQVIDDASFVRGQSNPQEGGPKGLDLSADGRLLVITCEEEPLVFVDLGTTHSATDSTPSRTNYDPRDALVARLRSQRSLLAAAGGELAAAKAELAHLRGLEDKIRAMEASHSWKVTKPLRSLSTAVRRPPL